MSLLRINDEAPDNDVIITGVVSNEEADKTFPGYKTVKPYLRTTTQPHNATTGTQTNAFDDGMKRRDVR